MNAIRRKDATANPMVYFPQTLLLRSDAGGRLPPVKVDMLTSCAMNAGGYLREADSTDESDLDETMKDRTAKVHNLVLGSLAQACSGIASSSSRVAKRPLQGLV